MELAGDGSVLVTTVWIAGMLAVGCWVWLLVDSRRRQMSGDNSIVVATAALVPAVLASAVAGLRLVPQETPLIGALGDAARLLADQRGVTTSVIMLLGLLGGLAGVINAAWYAKRVRATGSAIPAWRGPMEAGAVSTIARDRTVGPTFSGTPVDRHGPAAAATVPAAGPPPPAPPGYAPSSVTGPAHGFNPIAPAPHPVTPSPSDHWPGSGAAVRVDSPLAPRPTRSFGAPASAPSTKRLSRTSSPSIASWLVNLSGDQAGMEIPLGDLGSEHGILIGRDAQRCQVVLSDDTVSQLHARIVRDGDGFAIIDMGATNPVLVNGERAERSRLHDLDRITLGEDEFAFLVVPLGPTG